MKYEIVSNPPGHQIEGIYDTAMNAQYTLDNCKDLKTGFLIREYIRKQKVKENA